MNFPLIPEAAQKEIDGFYASSQKPDCEGRIADRGGSPRKRECELLVQLVLEYKPVSTLDWGLGDAAACMAIVLGRRALNLPGQHVSLDPFQRSISKDVGLIQLKERSLLADVEFLEDRSEEFLVEAAKAGRTFDFIFVDGDHSFTGKVTDAHLLDRVLVPGGVVAFHDGLFKSTAAAVTALAQFRGYNLLPTQVEPRWKILARQARHSPRLGWWYAMNVIPKMGMSVVTLQKRSTHVR